MSSLLTQRVMNMPETGVQPVFWQAIIENGPFMPHCVKDGSYIQVISMEQ